MGVAYFGQDMDKSNNGASRRLARLERVLESRRSRLALAVARQQARMANLASTGHLERHGYFVALLLALSAGIPTLVGFVFRRRKFLGRAAMNGLRVRKLRKQVDSIRLSESGR